MSSSFHPRRKVIWEQIYATVRKIPYGKVATYGQVARRTGQCTGQMVGHALADLAANTDVPSHRVVNGRGEISSYSGANRQRRRLMEEGISFDVQGRIDFKRYGYFPVSNGNAVRTPASIRTPVAQQPSTSRHTVPLSRQATRPKQAVSPSRAASPRSPTKGRISPRSGAESPSHRLASVRTARPRQPGTLHAAPSSRPAARPKQAVSPSRAAASRSPMSTFHCELCGTEYAASLTACPACGVGVAVDFSLPMGTELQDGKFTVGKVLGRGGFGITYKGAHRRLQRPVAIKELFPEFATRSGPRVTVTANRTEGFRREQESVVQEARVIASLNSHSIVDVHDFFHENGTVYIVMEYLEGPTLEQEIERLGQLSPKNVARVADEVCDALDTMHSTNFLHRDVKPANILLARDGRAVLIDFGSAREYEIGKTQSHTRLVTLDYAAPEQLSHLARFGPYTDLFCLGATLYHALTGTPPPPAMDRLQAADQTVKLPSAVPDSLRKAVQGALNCRIEDRPQTVKEFRVLLGGKKNPPVRPAAVPAPRTKAVATNHDGVPYEFRGKQYYTPKDLVAALAKDWDAAIKEWNAGYIRKWMTRGVVGGAFERTIDQMATDPLFSNDTELRAMAQAVSNHETAMQERRLMRVFSIMDPHWKYSYRGMPLQDKQAIGAWCQTDQWERRSLVHRCLTHGILLVHPKKFAVSIHNRTLKECGIYWAHLQSHMDVGELADEQHNAEAVVFQVFSILVDARPAKELIVQAQQDKKAMKIRWFSDLVGQATQSAGCALALAVLLPQASREHSRRQTVKIWIGIIGALLVLFLCGIVNIGV